MCISSALLTRINIDVENALCDFELSGAKRFACNALRGSIVKKFEDTSKEADKAALDKFLEVNALMGEYRVPTFLWTSLDAEMHHTLRYTLWKMLDGINRINPEEVISQMKIGPGASVGVVGGTLIEKLTTGGLTTTDLRLYQLWMAGNQSFGYIRACESIREQDFGPCKVVDGSTLTYVPKNRDISRTICTEPLLNMMFQQGIKEALELRLKRSFGIDLANQQAKNRLLARRGSESGQLATIDLSSASDSLSLTMVRSYFPKSTVDWLEFTRSPMTKLPNGEWLSLNMISSMGNAYTFPLQTILFAAVVQTVYRILDIPLEYPRGRSIGSFGVNGDDIIVDVRAFDAVVRLLEQLGFQVNREKTFFHGNFRESCGGDYYNGHNVRGVYARRLDTIQDIYSLINRLNDWSERNEIALPETVGWLVSQIKNEKLRYLYVPLDESDTAGIKVPYRFAAPKLVLNKGTGACGFLYKRFQPRSVRIEIPADSKYSYPLVGQILYGGAESLTRKQADGSTSEIVTIAVRPYGTVKYDLGSVVTPRWDYGEMTSRVGLAPNSTGLPCTRKYTVLNLRRR